MRIFIGSSSQARPLVREIASWLEELDHTPVCWDVDAFAPSAYTFQSLESLASNVDGAILLLTCDEQLDAEGKHAPNGNVLIELGLFCGTLGRMRVLVCREGKPTHPSDLNGITYVNVSQQKRNGARAKITQWAKSLSQRLATDAPDHVTVHPSFPLELFKDLLEQARHVRILQTFIPTRGHLDQFEGHLARALLREAEVDILLCHPRSKACKIREESLGKSLDVKQAVEQTYRRLGELAQKLDPRSRQRLTVRAHSTLPSVSFYQIDNTILCGHYFHRALAIDAPQLEMRTSAGAILARRLEREFDDICADKLTEMVDLDDLERWLRS